MYKRNKSVLGTLASFAVTAVVVGVSLTSCSNPRTPAGHEGYIYENPRIFGSGGYKGTLSGSSNFGVSLWRNEAINIDIRPNTYTETFQILAKDDLNISFNFHAVISIKQNTIKNVVEEYGSEKWFPRFVREPFRTFVRNSVQKYNSRDLKVNRDAISKEVTFKLNEYLTGSPFKLKSVVVGNINYPAIVATAVEKKLAAEQLLSEKFTQKEIAKQDAAIRVEEAKGIAKAQKIRGFKS